MKFSNLSASFQSLLTVALLAGTRGILPAQPANAQPVVAQQMFASPDDAVKALQAATASKDRAALNAIFGPEVKQVLTGDPVQDANNAQRFAAAMAQSCNQVPEGQDKITFEVGTNNWPMPIPLVRTNGQWYFDTAAGREEIINRHIGKDELHAIGVCRAYVTAQIQFASANPGRAAERITRRNSRARPAGRTASTGRWRRMNRPARSGHWWPGPCGGLRRP